MTPDQNCLLLSTCSIWGCLSRHSVQRAQTIDRSQSALNVYQAKCSLCSQTSEAALLPIKTSSWILAAAALTSWTNPAGPHTDHQHPIHDQSHQPDSARLTEHSFASRRRRQFAHQPRYFGPAILRRIGLILIFVVFGPLFDLMRVDGCLVAFVTCDVDRDVWVSDTDGLALDPRQGT